jgi:hypothetical protein
MERVRISVEKHGSRVIALVGHHDCAGNPTDREEQTRHTQAGMGALQARFPEAEVIGLWVDENWEAHEVEAGE